MSDSLAAVLRRIPVEMQDTSIRTRWLAEFENLEGSDEVIRVPSPRNPRQKKTKVEVKLKRTEDETGSVRRFVLGPFCQGAPRQRGRSSGGGRRPRRSAGSQEAAEESRIGTPGTVGLGRDKQILRYCTNTAFSKDIPRKSRRSAGSPLRACIEGVFQRNVSEFIDKR